MREPRPAAPAGRRARRCWTRRARSARAWRARSRLRGLFGVDFIWDGERAWTLEVNPRPTASLEAIEAAYGVGVFDAHLRGCAGELPRIEAERAGAAGKAVLFATEDVSIGDSERWLERGVRDVPHPGERIAAGRPICTVVTTAATPDDALAGLEAAGRAAARGAARGGAGGWLTRRARGAAALCDDIEVDARAGPVRTCPLGDAWFAERTATGRPSPASTAAR